MRGPFRLAWRQLTREKVRFGVALCGVAFAVVLMLMQLGFRSAMLRSSSRFHERLQADLVLISPQSPYLIRMASFPRRRLDQALGAAGVEAVAPVYATLAIWKNPRDGATRTVFLAGIDPDRETLGMPEVASQLDVLRQPERALFDRAARKEYGPVADWLREAPEAEVEVNGRRLWIGGQFGMGTSFGIDGTLITSDRSFLALTGHEPSQIEIGLIRLAPGADVAAVQAELQRALEHDVLVLTRDGYADRERTYWNSVTPIGYILGLGALIGFGVGAVIVSQILFADVSDHLAEYATMKAMGFRNRYLAAVVLSESLVLAGLGYLPGLAMAAYLYGAAERATRLPMELTGPTAGLVFALTLGMCCLSGMLALRKLSGADPAEIF